jgi:hypothetical protein
MQGTTINSSYLINLPHKKTNKYDILYTRVYPVGSINTLTGVGILMPRRYLPHIKDYVLHNFKLYEIEIT